MPVSEKKLKSVLKQGIKDFKEQRAAMRDDRDDPSDVAQNARDMVDEFVKELSNELDRAGDYVRSGLKDATKNYLDRKFDEEV